MAFIPVPNVAMVELVFTSFGVPCENTLYFESGTGWDTDGLADLAEQVKAWWVANMRAMQVNTVSLIAVKATDLSTQFSPGIEDVNGLPLAGTGFGTGMPNNVTVTTTFLTALRGRSYRGRNYFIGLSEERVVANTVNSSTQTDLVNAYEALATEVISNGAVHVVVSRFTALQPRVTGIGTPVTGYRVDPGVDTQRKRLK